MLHRFINITALCIGLLLLISCSESHLDSESENKLNPKDSIVLLINKGKISVDSIYYLDQAIRMAETKGYDSLWFSALDFRSNLLYKDKNYSSFYSDGKKYYKRALEKNDTLRKAEGGFKVGSYFLKRNILDSAFFFFYLASKDYQLLSDSVQAASNLLNMAIIQNYTRDFFGSEETSVRALSLLKNNPKPVKLLLGINNNLGMVTRNLNRYSESVKWYEKSLSFIRKPRERMVVLNNIGVSFKFQGQYKEAVEYFREALLLDSTNKNTLVIATLLDNMGHCLLLEKQSATLDCYNILNKAYQIRIKHSNELGLFESKLHLSEYFLLEGDLIKALEMAEEALVIAQKNGFTSNELRALKVLSERSVDAKWSKGLILRMDEIDRSGKSYQQQFASILYESELKEEKNQSLQNSNLRKDKSLKSQKKWGIVSLVVIGMTVILLISVYYNYKQQQKLHENQLLIERLKAKSEEKQLLSLHLHDDVSTDLLVGLQRAEGLLGKEDHKEWSEILDLFENSYEKLRIISQDISVTSFQGISFERKIGNLIQLFSFKNGLTISQEGIEEINWNEIAIDLKVELYLILKEALNNIIKHSQATRAIILFAQQGNKLNVSISDNGIGFVDVQVVGVGMLNIQSRIEKIEGKLKVISDNKGTTLLIELPKL